MKSEIKSETKAETKADMKTRTRTDNAQKKDTASERWRRSAVLVAAALGLALIAGLGKWAVGGPGARTAGPRPSAPAAHAAATAAVAIPAPAAKVASSDACAAICARTRELACPRTESCATSCGQMRDITICKAQMTEVLACMARQPLAGWVCGADGEAMLQDGRCDAEQERFTACARVHAAPGQ